MVKPEVEPGEDQAGEWEELLAHPVVRELLAGVVADGCRPGGCVWLTGIPGSGKSATAEGLAAGLRRRGRQVTILDGDGVRASISRDLGFSRADRDKQVRRVSLVAAEVARRGGLAVCALVSPYRAARREARAAVGPAAFVEVFVDTPLAVAEGREVKGRYAKARRGEIVGFTGVDDPYERPERPELVLDTVQHSVAENAALIMDYLEKRGLLAADTVAAVGDTEGA